MDLPNLQRISFEEPPSSQLCPLVLPVSWQYDGTHQGHARVYRQSGGLMVFMSLSTDEKTGKWVHLSMSCPDGYPPSWSQIMECRRLFFGDREAVMVIPRDDDEVDISKQLPPRARSPWHIWTRPWSS